MKLEKVRMLKDGKGRLKEAWKASDKTRAFGKRRRGEWCLAKR